MFTRTRLGDPYASSKRSNQSNAKYTSLSIRITVNASESE